MRLTGIDCQVPSRQIFNEDIIALVKHYSAVNLNDAALNELEILIRRLLFSSGINSRFWRHENERPIDLVVTAVEKALKMAQLQKADVDLVIYSGIDRGFIEPANASFICKSLGLTTSRSFDIVDACMGWATAVQVADSFLSGASPFNTILLVNAEFPMDNCGSVLPANFTIGNHKELRWKAASFSLGEAASACIFQRDAATNCRFEFIEHTDNAQLCAIALPNAEKYLSNLDNRNFETLGFYADSPSLIKNGISPAIEVLQNLLSKLNYKPKVVFPHSVSKKIIRDTSKSAGTESLICSTFSELGNLATASVPSSIKKALDENLVHKNEKGIVWIASAGMKFSAFEIQL